MRLSTEFYNFISPPRAGTQKANSKLKNHDVRVYWASLFLASRLLRCPVLDIFASHL